MDISKLVLTCIILYCMCSGFGASINHRSPRCSRSGKDKISIYCKNVSDISDVMELFKNMPPVYRIRLQGTFTTIPSRAFDGVSVIVLTMTAPLQLNIPEDSLFGIEDLRIIDLNATHFNRIPEALSNMNVSVFESTSGKLTTITTQLQNMSSATNICLSKNQISLIYPDAFLGTNAVQHLDLSYNELVYLDSETLESMRFLERIYLQHNHLHRLDGCLKLLNPKIVNLYGNNLTSLDHVLHRGLWNLENLNIGGNPELHLSSSTLVGTMKSLKEFHLSNNGYSNLDPYLFQSFWKLHDLYLNGNNLTYLPRYIFKNNPFLSVLQLSNNRLSSIEGVMVNRKEWYNWVRIKLDGNKLQNVAFGEKPLLVFSLDLSRNQISNIQVKDMEALQKMKETLNLSSNGLNSLENASFKNFNSLKFLDLSNNNLRSLNHSLEGLKGVQILWISSSSLENLSADEFLGLERIKSINLRNNSLRTVHGAFRSMKYISQLDLAMNNLTTLTVDSFPPFQQTSVRVRVLRMEGNPWACDCRLSWMANWITRPGSKLMDEPVCASPDHLRNQTIRSLNLTDYQRWPDDCPDACECICQEDGDLVYTEVRCIRSGLEDVPKVMPFNVRSVDLRGNAIRSFDSKNVLKFEHLERINLEHNNIEEVKLGVISPKLTSLKLAFNRLRTFPVDAWIATANHSILREISLSRNPWACNCNTWSFRNWLIQQNDTVVDVKEVQCGSDESFSLQNKPIISLAYGDLCTYLSDMTILSVCLVPLLVMFLLCLCYRHSLSALLYSWGCSCLKASETHDLPYDAFLMYSDDDEQLALGELANGLENRKRPFHLCIPSRDIVPPRTPQKINAYLPQCNKVIVLLTRSFIENRDCMRLLISAMSFSTESSARCIVFVTLGELPPPQELDSVLKTLLRSCICLRWNQRLFWQKLVYQLPKKGAKNHEYHNSDEELLSST